MRETKKSKEISYIRNSQGWAEFLTRCKNITDMMGNCSVGALACFYRHVSSSPSSLAVTFCVCTPLSSTRFPSQMHHVTTKDRFHVFSLYE